MLLIPTILFGAIAAISTNRNSTPNNVISVKAETDVVKNLRARDKEMLRQLGNALNDDPTTAENSFIDFVNSITFDGLIHFFDDDISVYDDSVLQKIKGSLYFYADFVDYLLTARLNLYDQRIFTPNEARALLDDVFFHNLWGKIYKSDLLKKFDYRNDENFKYGEDAALFYQIVNNAQKVSTIEKNVYNYYISIGCSSIDKLTNKHFEDRLKADRIIYDCCCKYPFLKSSLSHYLMIDIIKFFYILKSPMKDINKIVKKHGFDAEKHAEYPFALSKAKDRRKRSAA
mgnify:CR=1 FL=1